MKIVCDNCATKYSIADEKVRGKVFKIRCKKCSHIIVVRGNDGAAAAQPDAGGDAFPGDEPATTVAPGAAVGAPASDAVWHLVVDREQIGPLTAAEVRQKFAAGEVDVETYAWREGFADWLRLGSIDDFRDLGGAAAPAAEPEGATRRTDSADLFAGAGSADDSGAADAGADLFGSASAQAAAPAPAQAFASANGGGGLFGAPESSPAPAARPSRTSSPGFAPQPAASMSAGGEAVSDGPRPMTGQRNENSVLFSLNNLQALASGTGAAAPKPAGGGGVDNRPGFANSQTEGSGLIDIRAMAASTLAAAPATSSKNDEPEIAAAPIFSPMAAPILMPAAPSGPPKWIWAVIGVGVMAVLGIIVVGVLVLTRKPEPVVVAQPTAPAGANPAVAANTTNPATAAAPAAAAPAATEKAAPAEAKATEPKAEEKQAKAGKHEKAAAAHSERAAKSKNEPAAAAPAPTEAPPAPAPKKSGKHDAIDDLLDNATGGSDTPKASHKAAAEPAADSNLPEQLDKGQIVSGMGKVKARVGSCYDQFKVPGMAMAHTTIAKSGRVSSVSVTGSFAGTPTGACVEKAVKGASFPAFSGAPQTIDYPFMLR